MEFWNAFSRLECDGFKCRSWNSLDFQPFQSPVVNLLTCVHGKPWKMTLMTCLFACFVAHLRSKMQKCTRNTNKNKKDFIKIILESFQNVVTLWRKTFKHVEHKYLFSVGSRPSLNMLFTYASLGRGNCVFLLGKILYSHSASFHPGV